jgi:hypothetical protein
VQFGFNNSHTGVLKDDAVIRHIDASIRNVKSPYPESHIEVLAAGGFNVDLDSGYSRSQKYFIRERGKYLYMLANGTLDPLGDPLLEHFVQVAQGRAEASTDAEVAWQKFSTDYPNDAKTGGW